MTDRAASAIGIDLGGTNLRAGLVEDGRVVASRAAPTPANETPEATVEAIAALVQDLAAGSDEPVGIGAPGLVDPAGEVVRTSPNLPKWKDVPLARMVSEVSGRRVRLLNDANAFALGEAKRGAGRGAQACLGVTLGTGVGSGFVLRGALFTGVRGWAPELGHVPIVPDGRPCPCGGRGCLERYVGRDGLVASAREAGFDCTTPEEVARKAPEVFAEAARHLARALAAAALLYDLDRIVVGGGVAGAGEVLFVPLRAAFAEVLGLPLATEIVPAELGGEAGVVGAAEAALY